MQLASKDPNNTILFRYNFKDPQTQGSLTQISL